MPATAQETRRRTRPTRRRSSASRRPARRRPTTNTWRLARTPATSSRERRAARAAPAAATAILHAAREGAPAPTLLRTPRTRRRIWSSHHALRGRGALSARRRSAGATRTSPRSPCGGPAPRSTSRISGPAATAPPYRRSASTRRRGRPRITTVTLCPCNTRIQETPPLLTPRRASPGTDG